MWDNCQLQKISDKQNGDDSKAELLEHSDCQHRRAQNVCFTMDGKSKDVAYEGLLQIQ